LWLFCYDIGIYSEVAMDCRAARAMTVGAEGEILGFGSVG